MATSLAEQLQKLSVPQSSVYTDDKKKASLLFDPKDAAAKDKDTFYEIGISGLNELISLYEGFRLFEDTLFSIDGKDFERAVQSKEDNERLNRNIEKFLHQLSPYLLLQSSHKALEWLVNRYHIHQYNQDAIMALILPYHETKIFIRFIQLMDLKSNSNRWNWLEPLQKPGISLAKQVLYNHCAGNVATLKFIGKLTSRHVKELGERASQLSTVFAFFCSTVIGSIDSSKRITESLVTALLPTLNTALVSTVRDFRSSAYIIIGYLTTKIQLKETTLNDFIGKICNSDYDISYDIVLLINLMYSSQEALTTISDDIMYNMPIDRMQNLCLHLKKLMSQGIDISIFATKFLASILSLIQQNSEEFRRSHGLADVLINEIDFKKQSPEKIIKCILDSFSPGKYENENGYESDVEIVDEIDLASNEMTEWYSQLLRSVENKYPVTFDSVLKEVFDKQSGISQKRHNQLSKILSFKPSIVYKIGDNYLFENLNHANPLMRVEAIKLIAREFSSIKNDNLDFLRDSLLNRYCDDNYEVVRTALKIPIEYVEEILTSEELEQSLISIVTKNTKSKKWKAVIKEAIEVFCSLENLNVNQNTILALLPFLFPEHDNSIGTALEIYQSAWGKKFLLSRKVFAPNSDDFSSESLRNIFFMAITNESLDDDIEIDYNKVDQSNSLNVCMYLLLKSNSLYKATPQEITSFLNNITEFVKARQIQSSANKAPFSGGHMYECIKLCHEDKVLFQMIEYLFNKIIDNIHIKKCKPWINVCKTDAMILVRRLFEIFIVGCSLEDYRDSYCKLLQKLLAIFCENAKNKLEFIANFGCGHILYAETPDDIITPELQLRALKLLNNCLKTYENLTWIYESNIIIMILLNLGNPIAFVRKCTLDTIRIILSKYGDKDHCFKLVLKELLNREQELTLDHEQIAQVLYVMIHKKKTMKDALNMLVHVVTDGTPPYISSEVLKLMVPLNTPDIFSRLVPAAVKLTNAAKSKEAYTFDVYESKLLRNVYNRFNINTVESSEIKVVWDFIVWSMKEYRDLIVDEDQSLTSPCYLFMKQIDGDVFKKMPNDKATEFVNLVCNAGTFSNNPNIVSLASKLMKKIDLHIDNFKKILEAMLNVKDPTAGNPKKRKPGMQMLSYETAETDEWKRGLTMLEYIQTKKRMSTDMSFMSLLFNLLKKCLTFEEQSHVEYTKQLILSSIWFYCKKLTDKNQLKAIKSVFDIEQVVQCIRGTQNPQTHHHALILLSHAASILPDEVLNHTMAIFTFMGSSVLRYDDAYSFQIIKKIIENIIPIVVKLNKNIEEYSEKELQKLHKSVVPVIRIFADVVLDVPEHRRVPLYKQLIETLGASEFLWVFIGLLLENYIMRKPDENVKKSTSRSLAEQELPVNKFDFGQTILMEFPADVVLANFIKLITYLKTLPIKIDEKAMDTGVDPSEIFSVSGHTPLNLRYYRYAGIIFMNACLSSPQFIQHVRSAEKLEVMKGIYKSFIINILTFIQKVSKAKDETEKEEINVKYWIVMSHKSYDLLDNVNNLLSAPMFLSVVRGLLNHTLPTVKRRSMELLISKIQNSPEMFSDVDRELLYSLFPSLINIVKSIDTVEPTLSANALQEIELNQQTSLLALKLLTRMLASENPVPFKPILECITEYISNPNISGNVMASIVLCLAELCSNLKAHALVSLKKFMPALIKVLKMQRKAKTPELILLSTVTAVCKIVESLPLFLSPYLQKILYEYSILLAKWQRLDKETDKEKVEAVVTKLASIKKKIASSIAPRVLIPVVNETYQLHLAKKNLDAIGPVMAVLADSFVNITSADFAALQQDLTAFSLSALQLRSNAVNEGVDISTIDAAEGEIVNALVSLVLKLSETTFRPFYFKIYDWAIRTNVDNEKDRVITFYRLSNAIGEKLKGLFVLFAGHFIKNAADLLDACNKTKTEELFFEDEQKCATLLEYILKTLKVVFLYDTQNFLNKDRFETLMQPIVDQLENNLCGLESLKKRAENLIIPCISQFAVAIADDSLWKPLNYHVLLKTRHNDGVVRLIALDCLVTTAGQLGSSWLPLLAESVPFLAELLEDSDPTVENDTKQAIRKLELILEEPLDKYF